MKSVRKRLTYANVMSSLAVFLVIAGGSALAATKLAKNSVGSAQIKKNAVTSVKVKKGAITGSKIAGGAVGASALAGNSVGASAIADNAVSGSKIASNAVSSDKIADNAVIGSKIAGSAVSGDKIAAGAVGTGNLADGSVTTEKLAAATRSHAYQIYHEGTQNVEIPTGLLGNFATATALASLTVPAGSYVVSASTEFINSALAPRSAICRLFEGATEIGEGSTPIGESILVGQGTAPVTALSSGGTLTLRCRASGASVFDWDAKITAVSVNAVN